MSDIFHAIIDEEAIKLSEKITMTIKELLETKHLYQSIHIPLLDKLSVEEQSKIKKYYDREDLSNYAIKDNIARIHSIYTHKSWEPIYKVQSQIYNSRMPQSLLFLVPHVKLFCHKCQRIEAFNYVSGYDMLQPSTEAMAAIHIGLEPSTQIFVFSFHCQSCKGVPEVFLVRREKNKLTLSGRSPIEHVEIPSVIPKTVKQFFSDAIVAHQSGQTLAGVFLFRVFIEQWTQSQCKTNGLKADKAIDEYMNSLPDDFKKRFPSFKSIYEKLSVDIHSAIGSAELFEETRVSIIEHFDASRLYKLK